MEGSVLFSVSAGDEVEPIEAVNSVDVVPVAKEVLSIACPVVVNVYLSSPVVDSNNPLVVS